MAFRDYIDLDGKRYKVTALNDQSYQPVWDRQKTDEVGLTGLTIMQDFTFSNRVPRLWHYTLRIFVNDPWPDSAYGVWNDFLIAYEKAYVTMIEHDDTQSHEVRIRSSLIPQPRVPGDITG